jgi:2-polyprenyl-6-hydroxyphenyl methylase/3-demethylubiquinone-9 3-methyltransferase
VVAPLRIFFDANRRLSAAVADLWPHQRESLETRYNVVAAEAVHRRPGQLVVDVGGGKSLRYSELIRPGDAYIVAVDISEEELSGNEEVNETRVADVTSHLPFETAEVDLLTSSSVLEHLPNVSGFLDEAARVLKDDAVMIHIFPGRYAAFALLNRVMPEDVKRWLLYRLYPQTVGVCGFPAFYDLCYPSGMEEACRARGFDVEVFVRYYGSADYFTVFFPLFLLFFLWELFVRTIGARDLAAQVLLVAHRRRAPEPA